MSGWRKDRCDGGSSSRGVRPRQRGRSKPRAQQPAMPVIGLLSAQLAADLVRRRVAVIGASGTAAAPAAKVATTTIPIVFSSGADPVALGLVASLNRPGANLTGSASLAGELAPKRLQLLRELLPNAALFGVLADPAFPVTQSTIADLQAAARMLGLQLVVVNASTDRDLEPAFATFSQQHVGAVLVSDSTLYTRRAEQLAGWRLAMR
jgi:putative tryptophan/tyrosine transport system substrate-binding protein